MAALAGRVGVREGLEPCSSGAVSITACALLSNACLDRAGWPPTGLSGLRSGSSAPVWAWGTRAARRAHQSERGLAGARRATSVLTPRLSLSFGAKPVLTKVILPPESSAKQGGAPPRGVRERDSIRRRYCTRPDCPGEGHSHLTKLTSPPLQTSIPRQPLLLAVPHSRSGGVGNGGQEAARGPSFTTGIIY